MNSNDDCIFCKNAVKSDNNNTYGFIPNEVLPSLVFCETGDFFFTLDIAPIVPNHCLFVSKKHVLGFTCLSIDEISTAINILEKFTVTFSQALGKPITVFEHSGTENIPDTCCINHAHIHILPLSIDFSPRFKKDGIASFGINNYKEAQQKLQGKPYFFYKPPNSEGCFYDATNLPSQYIRILYANVRKDKLWNWHDRVCLTKNKNLPMSLKATFDLLSKLNFQDFG